MKLARERAELISIHAPRGGSDTGVSFFTDYWQDFNPRSPRGERRPVRTMPIHHRPISIHAPRGGSDLMLANWCPSM